MRVLVTVGSMAEKKFTRLFQAVDELCRQGVLQGEMVTAQVGFDGYRSRYYQCFDMVSRETFEEMIRRSDLIITHAGTGTVVTCLKNRKKVIVFPRMAQYDEHYDDHQLELAELFSRENHVLTALDLPQLVQCISQLDDFHPAPFLPGESDISRLVIDFIERERESGKGRRKWRR